MVVFRLSMAEMDLNRFNALFLRAIDFYYPNLAYPVPSPGGPTVIISKILIAGSSVVQIHLAL